MVLSVGHQEAWPGLFHVWPQFSAARAPQVAEGKGESWENELPAVGDDHLQNLKMHKSTGPDEMRPGVLRTLVHEVAKPHIGEVGAVQ